MQIARVYKLCAALHWLVTIDSIVTVMAAGKRNRVSAHYMRYQPNYPGWRSILDARRILLSACLLEATALVAGKVEWTEGRKMESLIQEIAHGNVSISIYHLDGVEVGQVQPDKVHAFPRT
ncbi:hypothetical protein [Janthinobacterium sp. PSPC3-1]|uniref:hypothetical protein n=2 Tax=unclassified Janthinobacterium TaxID=2610881 RepID=UPI003CE8DB49